MTIQLHISDEIPALLQRIDALAPLLQSEAADGERLRRPTPQVQAALRDSGLFLLSVPKVLGGYEASPVQVLEVMERLARADASIGWLARALTIETGKAATYLGDEAVAELFGDGKCPLVAGISVGLPGTAVAEDGGFRVSGAWRFAPGLSMATHVHLLAHVEGTDDDIVCLVPRDSLWLTDNWDMLGLRATASLDYEAKDVFVPERFTFRIGPEHARRGGVANRLSPALIEGLNQAAWAQGVGRRLLEELQKLTQRPTPGAITASNEFFEWYARHFSHVCGTMALLRTTWSDNEKTMLSGAELTDHQETMSRLSSSLATRTALEIGQLVHRFAGAQVLRNGTIQRFFRDIHAGTLHRGTATDVVQQCGRMLCEVLPEGSHWGFFNLVVPDAADATA